MAVYEAEREVNLPADQAFDFVEQKLIQAGFKNVQVLRTRNMIRAEKRTFGQWTKSPIEVSIVATPSGGSIILASAMATAQSLSSGNPARRMVDDFMRVLGS